MTKSNMDVFQWDHSFETGIAKVDHQHHHLLTLRTNLVGCYHRIISILVILKTSFLNWSPIPNTILMKKKKSGELIKTSDNGDYAAKKAGKTE